MCCILFELFNSGKFSAQEADYELHAISIDKSNPS